MDSESDIDATYSPFDKDSSYEDEKVEGTESKKFDRETEPRENKYGTIKQNILGLH